MHSATPSLVRQLAPAFLLLALSLLGGPQAHAQAASTSSAKPASGAFTGPYFPGGPDSLRALVSRTQLKANPSLNSPLFLRIELDKSGVASKAYYLQPATGQGRKLARSKEAQAFIGQLTSQLPAFQPETKTSQSTSTESSSLTVPLTFGSAKASTALLYSEEYPVFPLPASTSRLSYHPMGYVIDYLSRQVRYPADDIRSRTEGVVYAYFEVSETGVVEQRAIAGSVSPTLDAEVLRVLNRLPNATTPPQHQGKPVRVAYVLPMNFKVQ
jgi:protein TonB